MASVLKARVIPVKAHEAQTEIGFTSVSNYSLWRMERGRRAGRRCEARKEEEKEDKKGKMSCAEKLREIARKNRLFRRARIYLHLRDTPFTSIKFYGIYATRIEFGGGGRIYRGRMENIIPYEMPWLKTWLEKFRRERTIAPDDSFKHGIT